MLRGHVTQSSLEKVLAVVIILLASYTHPTPLLSLPPHTPHSHTTLTHHTQHYDAVMKYISSGPLLVDVSMNSPSRMTRSFMDSLLAFWPGLQVLWGDVDAAIHTHDMLYHVTERHNFLPEVCVWVWWE